MHLWQGALLLATGLLLAGLPHHAPGSHAVSVAHPAQDEETCSSLIERGRARLDERRPVEAEALFQRASELAGTEAETRRAWLWTLRAWMDQGRSNDTLDAIDALGPDRASAAERDYLYGMAFLRRAETYIAQGVTDQSIQMNFLDANERLARALAAEPERFPDAYLALAKAAWFAQDLPGARSAAERAVEVRPSDARSWHQLGHVALSQFVTQQKALQDSPPAPREDPPPHWERACAAFARAVAYFGRPLDVPEDQALLADAATQLGHARIWRRDLSRAADAYATALAWAPERADFRTLYDLLTRPADANAESGSTAYFLRALEEGARRFRETFGDEDPRDATLHWWLGWSRFHADELAASEAAFLRALERTPTLAGAWVYVARARHALGNAAGAEEALVRGWNTDPALVVAELQQGLEENERVLALLVDAAWGRGDLERAALLAEVQAEARPQDPTPWNNLGFFLVKRCEELAELEPTASRRARLLELAERALVAYGRALELTPQDPRLLNDLGALLQHQLKRDLDRARELLERALALSRAALADPALDAQRRAFHESVVADAEANLAEL